MKLFLSAAVEFHPSEGHELWDDCVPSAESGYFRANVAGNTRNDLDL